MPAIHGVTLTMVLHARGSGDAIAVAAGVRRLVAQIVDFHPGADHLATRCAASSA